MATLTTRLQLTKPASSENVDISLINDNFDRIDTAGGVTTGSLASRPASATNGRLFYATDSNKLYVNEAANASTVASWSDPVADSLGAIGSLSISGSLTVGTGLTVTTGKGTKTYVRKSTNESLASNITMQNDDHLTFSLAASAVYQLEAHLAVTGPAAGDIKTQWSITGPASAGNHANRWAKGPSTASTDVTNGSMRSSRLTWSASATYGTDGTNTSYITEGGLLDTTVGGSGTITLQWAQNSSNATSTVMSTSSYAILERLA